MADLKKKFMDILFDEDDDENQSVENYVHQTKKIEESPIRAKDILYRRSNKNTFIDLNEPKKPTIIEDKPVVEEITTKDSTYEMSSHISPIFGPVKENKKKDINVNQEIIDTQTSKPAGSHLDIITSPIYGYGNKEDAQKNNYDVKGIDGIANDEQELHELFDDDNVSYLNNSFAIDNINKKVEDTNSSNNQEDTDEINLFKLFGENQ